MNTKTLQEWIWIAERVDKEGDAERHNELMNTELAMTPSNKANKTAKDIEFLKSLESDSKIIIFKKPVPFMFIKQHDIFKLEYDGDLKPCFTLHKKKIYTTKREELGYFEIVEVKSLLGLIEAHKNHNYPEKLVNEEELNKIYKVKK